MCSSFDQMRAIPPVGRMINQAEQSQAARNGKPVKPMQPPELKIPKTTGAPGAGMRQQGMVAAAPVATKNLIGQ